MKNFITLTGRLPKFNGTYTPAAGDKRSRLNWAMNVQTSQKKANGYYAEGTISLTFWGYYADMMNEIMNLPWEDENRQVSISVSGKFSPGYIKKNESDEEEFIPSASIDVLEAEVIQKRASSNTGAGALDVTPSAAAKPVTKGPGVGGAKPAPRGIPNTMPLGGIGRKF